MLLGVCTMPIVENFNMLVIWVKFKGKKGSKATCDLGASLHINTHLYMSILYIQKPSLKTKMKGREA
jgi:hypothetical protein